MLKCNSFVVTWKYFLSAAHISDRVQPEKHPSLPISANQRWFTSWRCPGYLVSHYFRPIYSLHNAVPEAQPIWIIDYRYSHLVLSFVFICKFHMIKMSSIEQFKVCTITQHTNADSATSHQGLPLSTQSNFECDKIHVGCISGTAEKSERLFQVRWNLPKCIYLRENLLSTISKWPPDEFIRE